MACGRWTDDYLLRFRDRAYSNLLPYFTHDVLALYLEYISHIVNMKLNVHRISDLDNGFLKLIQNLYLVFVVKDSYLT